MIWWALVPHALGALAYVFGPWLGRRLRPFSAVPLLSLAAATIAAGTVGTLAIVAYIGVGDLAPIGPRDWSASDLRGRLPISPLLGAIAAVAVGVVAIRAATGLARSIVSHRSTMRLLDKLPEVSGLTLLRDEAPVAYALPTRGGGRVVVSTGLLRCLNAPQRRALLAHERAHLDLRHHWYSQLARLSAIANPLLGPLAAAVDRAIERCADLEAVKEVGDPRLVAEAVGMAALTVHASPRVALGAGQSDVVERVRLLLAPEASPKRGEAVLLACLVGLCWASLSLVAGHVYVLIEAIEATGF